MPSCFLTIILRHKLHHIHIMRSEEKNCTFIQLLVKTWHSRSKNRKPSSENVLFDEKPNVLEYSNLFFSNFLKIEFNRFF